MAAAGGWSLRGVVVMVVSGELRKGRHQMVKLPRNQQSCLQLVAGKYRGRPCCLSRQAATGARHCIEIVIYECKVTMLQHQPTRLLDPPKAQ